MHISPLCPLPTLLLPKWGRQKLSHVPAKADPGAVSISPLLPAFPDPFTHVKQINRNSLVALNTKFSRHKFNTFSSLLGIYVSYHVSVIFLKFCKTSSRNHVVKPGRAPRGIPSCAAGVHPSHTHFARLAWWLKTWHSLPVPPCSVLIIACYKWLLPIHPLSFSIIYGVFLWRQERFTLLYS